MPLEDEVWRVIMQDLDLPIIWVDSDVFQDIFQAAIIHAGTWLASLLFKKAKTLWLGSGAPITNNDYVDRYRRLALALEKPSAIAVRLLARESSRPHKRPSLSAGKATSSYADNGETVPVTGTVASSFKHAWALPTAPVATGSRGRVGFISSKAAAPKELQGNPVTAIKLSPPSEEADEAGSAARSMRLGRRGANCRSNCRFDV
ncbi:hypothetical protein GGTG_00234 [Gaeumannomyces tritici R3-111a-1]|uniref:Uncharacterized protein n=1 Tax=Gaeumannomyces tritici (strain R3-111a-1) TaxID=644352 RepID=J3NG41_GAET3|nr:hypothetical protein GGTG_00234 [Gaeumannomyces tritici R3-111a-1]EJT80231.1 hypothetical protein GGTG_00234 [Gaeumannomyces tritici R3-111a-1]